MKDACAARHLNTFTWISHFKGLSRAPHKYNKTKSIKTACSLRFTYTAHEHILKITKFIRSLSCTSRLKHIIVTINQVYSQHVCIYL